MIILNKVRNELGRKLRSLYEGGARDSVIRRCNLRDYQPRSDGKCGVVNTFRSDNIVLRLYETAEKHP